MQLSQFLLTSAFIGAPAGVLDFIDRVVLADVVGSVVVERGPVAECIERPLLGFREVVDLVAGGYEVAAASGTP